MGVFVLVIVVYAMASAAFTSWVAGEKGRDSTTWAVLGFFFGALALLSGTRAKQ